MPDALIWGFAVSGAMVGSFLNVCIHRLPAGESVVTPRSYCPACGGAIVWYDNVPVLSYVALGGRCRACSEPIPLQYPIVELATAFLWAAAGARAGLGANGLAAGGLPVFAEGLRSAVFLTILLGIALIDARHYVIPDQFSLGGAFTGLVFAAAPGGFPLRDAAIGASVGYGLLWLVKIGGEKLFRKPALGVGDIHMMAMVGAFLGSVGMLLTLLLGSLLGLVVGVPVSWWKGKLSLIGTYLPLGTFLAMGAAIAHGWGDALVGWYMRTVLGLG